MTQRFSEPGGIVESGFHVRRQFPRKLRLNHIADAQRRARLPDGTEECARLSSRCEVEQQGAIADAARHGVIHR